MQPWLDRCGYGAVALAVGADGAYPYFTAEAAFSPAVCARLEGLFDQDLPWRAHGGSFYEVRNCDVTDRLEPDLLAALAARTRTLTGLPLTQRVAITAQTMEPGQRIGESSTSDRPAGQTSIRSFSLSHICFSISAI